MSSFPLRNDGGMRTVMLVTAAVAIVLSWSVFMFDLPVRGLDLAPDPWQLAVMAAACTVGALAILRFKWVTVVALPVAAIFATACAALMATRIGAAMDDVIWAGPPPLPYADAALITVCGSPPLSVAIAATFRRLGWSGKSCVSLGAVLCLSPFLVFAGLNVADYAAFRMALRRAESVNREQLIAMARRCAHTKQHQRFSGRDCPREFAPLHPEFVNLSPGYAYASLYSRGDVYVQFSVETEGDNARAFVFTNSDGQQKTVPLPLNDPARSKSITRDNPIVTLSLYGADRPQWTVFPDRVHAVGFDDTGKRRDVEAVLSAADRDVIERAAADVERRLGGRAFEAPVIDGEGMIIHFGGLGEHTDRDIILHNAWVPQAAPLIIAVARVAPAEMPLRFAQRLARLHADEPPMPVQVLPIADVRDEHPQLPWWCAWRQWLNPQLTSPNVITGTSYIPDPLRYVYRDE